MTRDLGLPALWLGFCGLDGEGVVSRESGEGAILRKPSDSRRFHFLILLSLEKLLVLEEGEGGAVVGKGRQINKLH